MTPTPKPETPKSSLVTKKPEETGGMPARASKFGMVVYISCEGEVHAYHSDHELLRKYNKRYYKDEAFLTKDTVTAMLAVLEGLDSEKDPKFRAMIGGEDMMAMIGEEYTNIYKAAVLGDFMECVGRPAQDGVDEVSACVLVEVPC